MVYETMIGAYVCGGSFAYCRLLHCVSVSAATKEKNEDNFKFEDRGVAGAWQGQTNPLP